MLYHNRNTACENALLFLISSFDYDSTMKVSIISRKEKISLFEIVSAFPTLTGNRF